MKNFALVGNPNCGKTTLFNVLTGSTAHVGNWPGVTVDKKVGTYKKSSEQVSIIDLPGIYSLSPYTDEEVISRNYILDEKPDCIINIIDTTNLERNLYLTTQLMEIDVPIVIALNMMDIVKQNGDVLDAERLEKELGLPVIEISALRQENIDRLMDIAIATSLNKRKASTVIKSTTLSHLVGDVTIAFRGKRVDNPLFHAVKFVELDELEVKDHPDLIEMVEEFKATFNDELFGTDFEAVIADARYRYITEHYSPCMKKHKNEYGEDVNLEKQEKIDRVMTHKIWGIPLFLLILFGVFHLTFSEDLLYIGSLINLFGGELTPSFEGSIFEGLLWTDAGINSPGVILFNLLGSVTDFISSSVSGGMESLLSQGMISEWTVGFVVDGMLGGLFAVLSFVPQILLLFLFFSILEDSGYMARVAFILDRLFRKLGLSGRSFMPMIMGFGCSVPAMVNTRTLSDDNEKLATIRVIPFFSCGAKLPILTGIAGGLGMAFDLPHVDIITYSMYVLGMVVAVVTIILMRKTTLRGKVPPFIMELPQYRMPQFKSTMLHLWDKLKHFIHKAFTIILASTIVIWFLTNFSWNWKFVGTDMDNSILASLGQLIQPLFTPLGFGSQLAHFGWVFAVACVTGLIAKENVIATFYTLACCIITYISKGETSVMIPQEIMDALLHAGSASEDGFNEAAAMIFATGINVPGAISFIAFNMLTIPCFATVATAKAELSKSKFNWTLVFWVVTSYIVSMMIYLIGTWWWTSFIFSVLFIVAILGIRTFNKVKPIK